MLCGINNTLEFLTTNQAYFTNTLMPTLFYMYRIQCTESIKIVGHL